MGEDQLPGDQGQAATNRNINTTFYYSSTHIQVRFRDPVRDRGSIRGGVLETEHSKELTAYVHSTKGRETEVQQDAVACPRSLDRSAIQPDYYIRPLSLSCINTSTENHALSS